VSLTLSGGEEGSDMARVRKIDNPRVIALTGCNECDQFTVVCVHVVYNVRVYSFKYEGWNFNNGNTAVETPCNGTK
jgi:hypothetical protein